MKYESVDQLMEESHNDLVSIANSEFNMGLNKSFTKKQIATLIMNQQRTGKVHNEDIEVLRGDRSKNYQDEKLAPGYAIIRLQRSKNNQSGYPVPYGIQGKVGLIPVGKNIKVPEYVIEILSNALKEEIMKDRDMEEEQTIMSHAYPFTVLKHNPSDNWDAIEKNIEKTTGMTSEAFA